MNKTNSKDGMIASEHITNQIEELTDWRGKMLAQLRGLIHEAAPDITEEWKWGSAVFSQKGMVCSTGVFKDHVKINFFKGASLEDKQNLFNAGLDAKATRAIDFSQGDVIREAALKDLIQAAVVYNVAGGKTR